MLTSDSTVVGHCQELQSTIFTILLAVLVQRPCRECRSKAILCERHEPDGQAAEVLERVLDQPQDGVRGHAETMMLKPMVLMTQLMAT